MRRVFQKRKCTVHVTSSTIFWTLRLKLCVCVADLFTFCLRDAVYVSVCVCALRVSHLTLQTVQLCNCMYVHPGVSSTQLLHLVPVGIDLCGQALAKHMPIHPCLRLVSSSEEFLTMTFSRHVVTMEKVAEYDASKQREYAAAVAAHMVDNPVYDPEGTMDGTSYSINAGGGGGGGDVSSSGSSAATNEGSSKVVRPEDLFRQTSMNFSRFDARVRDVRMSAAMN